MGKKMTEARSKNSSDSSGTKLSGMKGLPKNLGYVQKQSSVSFPLIRAQSIRQRQKP